MNAYNLIGRYLAAGLFTLIVHLALTKGMNIPDTLSGFLTGTFFIWMLEKVENA